MQEFIVGIIVMCAAFAVLRRYGPKAWKQFFRTWSAKIATKLGWHGMAAHIAKQAEAGASCGDGCGSCGSCGTSSAISTDAAKEKHATISVESLKLTAQSHRKTIVRN